MTNKTPKTATLNDTIAISIQYDDTKMSAPKVTAKGTGYIAKEIIKIAKENDIPLQSDHQLVELLSQVEIDEEIPALLYETIAQVLIFAYQLSDKAFPTPSAPPK